MAVRATIATTEMRPASRAYSTIACPGRRPCRMAWIRRTTSSFTDPLLCDQRPCPALDFSVKHPEGTADLRTRQLQRRDKRVQTRRPPYSLVSLRRYPG